MDAAYLARAGGAASPGVTIGTPCPGRSRSSKDFGVFKLYIQGGTCTTAHRVAKAWMKRFERNLHNGSEKRPRSVRGVTFKSLPSKEAQTFRERGTRDLTTINFKYRVPNG
jgi:hypothetical protein